MPRSSRHKSHKNRDRSGSAEEEPHRSRKRREEGPDSGLGSRISWDPEPEPEKMAKKRREGSDRWNGEAEERVRSKVENYGGSDSKKSSRRPEEERRRGEAKERDGESSLSRTHDRKGYEVGKERGREFEKSRERGSERENRSRRDREVEKVNDYRRERERERSVDVANRNSHNGNVDGEYSVKGDPENTDWKIQDKLTLPRLEKDKRKHGRVDGSCERDKWQGSGDRKSSFTGDRSKNESEKDGRYREKYNEDPYKKQKHPDDNPHDDRSSRYRNRSEMKHSEFRKEGDLQDYCHEDSWNFDGNGNEDKSSKREKRFFDKNEERGSLKSKIMNSPQSGAEQRTSSRCKPVHDVDGDNVEHLKTSKLDGKYIWSENSPGPTLHAKAEHRHDSAPIESTFRSMSKERHHTSSASSEEFTGASGAIQGALKFKSESSRAKRKDSADADEMLEEDATDSPPFEKTRTYRHSSPLPIKEKPSLSRDQLYSRKKSAGHNSDIEDMGQRSQIREREPDLVSNKPSKSDKPQIALPILPRSSSSPSHSIPPPPLRHGIDSPSVLGSFEDCNRAQGGDRKSTNRHKRSGDPSTVRGQGNTWKGIPNWPSPIPNGFLPFQHGPSPTGFHPVMQQFPAPSMFGVRPFLDVNHTGVPFHMHESSDRFSTHSLAFDSCPPRFHGWDGNNPVFGDDPHMFGRLDWEQKRQMNNRGLEMNGDPLREQKENLTSDSQASGSERGPLDKNKTRKADHPQIAETQSEDSAVKKLGEVDVKHNFDAPTKTHSANQIIKSQKPAELTEISEYTATNFCKTCLSKLDLSVDLTQPEFYKKYVDFAHSGDTKVVTANMEPMQCKDTRVGIKMAIRSFKRARNPLLPVVREDAYKKAILLYMNLDGGFKPKSLSASLMSKIEEVFAKTSEPGVGTVANHTSMVDILEENASMVDILEENADTLCMKEECEEKPDVPLQLVSGDPDKQTESILNDVPLQLGSGSPDNQTDSILNDTPFAEESAEICESLITECLNRIHSSPESTH